MEFGIDLLAVECVVDQADRLCLVCVVRSGVDKGCDVGGRFVTRLRNGACEAGDVFVQNCVDHLALAFGHFLSRVLVGRVLVFWPDLDHVRLDAELVERAPVKHRFGGESVYVNVAGRRQKDLVGGRRDVIFAIRADLHVGVDGLAGCFEVGDRLALMRSSTLAFRIWVRRPVKDCF